MDLSSPLKQYSYNVQKYICDAIKTSYPTDVNASRVTIADVAASAAPGIDVADLRNWRLWGAYIGVEVQNADGAHPEGYGTAPATYRFSNLEVLKTDGVYSQSGPNGRCP